jgi:hypothetical protein
VAIIDQTNRSLTKLRDKKEKSLSDEKNLFKVRSVDYSGQWFEIISLFPAGARF